MLSCLKYINEILEVIKISQTCQKHTPFDYTIPIAC